MKKKIAIAGSGIAGLTLACLLKKNSDSERKILNPSRDPIIFCCSFSFWSSRWLHRWRCTTMLDSRFLIKNSLTTFRKKKSPRIKRTFPFWCFGSRAIASLPFAFPIFGRSLLEIVGSMERLTGKMNPEKIASRHRKTLSFSSRYRIPKNRSEEF